MAKEEFDEHFRWYCKENQGFIVVKSNASAYGLLMILPVNIDLAVCTNGINTPILGNVFADRRQFAGKAPSLVPAEYKVTSLLHRLQLIANFLQYLAERLAVSGNRKTFPCLSSR